jgi:DNA polymerase III delta prime subunit
MNAPTADWIEELSRTVSSRLVESAVHGEDKTVVRRRREALRAFEESLPPLYRDAQFGHPDFRRRVPLATIPMKPPTSCVLFFGASGSGKTTLAIALIRALFESKIAAHPLTCDDDIEAILRDCRFAHAHRLGSAALVPGDPVEIKRAKRAAVLLIDDLGRDEDIKSNPVPAIIADRHAEERLTWITTELTPPEIAKRYGDGIARRICENAAVVRFARSQLVSKS